MSSVVKGIGGFYSGTIGKAIGGPIGNALIGANATANNMLGMGDSPAPPPPGSAQGLSGLKRQQLNYANQFQNNLPQMQQKMAGQLTNQSNQQMTGQLRQNENQNSSRGLLYGGVNQGQQAGIRANAQVGLASAISGSNADLQNASQTLRQQALQTGMGIQQNQQSIQNMIYQQQMGHMQAQNAATGNMIGTGLMLALA